MTIKKDTSKETEKLFSFESMDCREMESVLYERFSEPEKGYILNIFPYLQYNAQVMEFVGDRSNISQYNILPVVEVAELTLQHNKVASTHHTLEITPHSTTFYIGGVHRLKKFLIVGSHINPGNKIIAPAKVCICDITGYYVRETSIKK